MEKQHGRNRAKKGQIVIKNRPKILLNLLFDTALGVQRDLVKSLSTLYHSLHRHLATCWHNGIDGHAQMFISVQHLLVLWLILSLAVYTVSRLCKNYPFPEAPAMSLPQ